MRVLVVDDEQMARDVLVGLIQSNYPKLDIVGEADSVESAVKLIKKSSPDLVFLDVDIKGGSGFDVLSLLGEIKFKVIFVTAHSKYAIKAIKFSALDFILKPVSISELTEAVLKVSKETDKHSKVKFDNLINNHREKLESSKKIVLNTSESVFLVKVADIVACKSDNSYTSFYLTDGSEIVVSKSLRDYEDVLTEHNFFRAHRSFLVNVNKIVRLDKKEGGFIIMSSGLEIPVSRRKKQELINLLD